jgi:dihydropteroate synthase
MGVVNITPDSFSDGGRFLDPLHAVRHGEALAAEGAHILDLGAESSRPGSDPVPIEEEWSRLAPVLIELRRRLPDLPLSVDTTKAELARRALDAGADIINDISAGRMDEAMLPLAAERQIPTVLMHMRGTPKTMQDDPHYDDVAAEVAAELKERARAAQALGLPRDRIVLDPGIGFGKRVEDNLALVERLEVLAELGYPVLVGASRKSAIGKITGAGVDDRLPGTLAFHIAAFLHGASIFRVHDAAPHLQALQVIAALRGSTT